MKPAPLTSSVRRKAMAAKAPIDIRGTLLTVISEQQPKGATDGSLQTGSVLRETGRRIGAAFNIELEQALLTQLHDLFRTGYLAWGYNLSNPSPPFCHVTERGRQLLEKLSRNPANPVGYRAHLYSVAKVNYIARSYVEEGLECYVSILYKAAAVMIGGAAESMILELRDSLQKKLTSLGRNLPKDLDDWRVKRVIDSMQGYFSSKKAILGADLKEEFEAYWTAFSQQIRAVRNEAGHPSIVDPVTPDSVHASLLIFPELVKLQNKLVEWVRKLT